MRHASKRYVPPISTEDLRSPLWWLPWPAYVVCGAVIARATGLIGSTPFILIVAASIATGLCLLPFVARELRTSRQDGISTEDT